MHILYFKRPHDRGRLPKGYAPTSELERRRIMLGRAVRANAATLRALRALPNPSPRLIAKLRAQGAALRQAITDTLAKQHQRALKGRA